MCCKKLPAINFLLSDGAVLPKYESRGAAGADIVSIESAPVFPGNWGVFRTGLKVEIPTGYVMMIYSRSGHGFKHNVRLSNCVGVIDSDYRGEIMVKLKNDGSLPFIVNAGDRIAQFVIQAAPQFEFEVQENLTSTVRGENGFGSTGA